MLSNLGIPGLILLVVILGLIILFVVSFTLFIRRVLINSSQKNKNQIDFENRLDTIENKIDTIIEKINKGNT